MPEIPLQVPVELLDTVNQILENNRTGISEFEMIRQLQADLDDLFPPDCFSDSLIMFRCHFLLMHCLYLLQQQRLQQQSEFLDIGQLSFRLLPRRESVGTGLMQADPLAEYYLDFSNLHTTDRQAVDNMLDRFWQRFLAQDHIADALTTLELTSEADFREIKIRYRQLCQRHHPDKGGCAQKFRDLSRAYQILRQAKG